ncbi:hypothetical protein ABS768_12340 [Flavobacterium sp. ST-75]|uniref:GIY-YIG domain-containing protein n=1 Tax=Flavobacterium rhizophilum TaxID=3163296 RepID=A0ABW8YG72_9FLAO
MKYKEIIKETQDSLSKLSEQLNNIEIKEKYEFEIQSHEFYEFQDKSKLNSITANFSPPLIYTIDITDSYKLQELLKKYQNRPHGLKTSKFNYRNKEVPVQNTLYVGSTIKNFYSRLKQHLGLIGKNLYSMHLSRWDEQMIYTIKVTVYKIKNIKDPEIIITQNIVEVIEQQIWDKLQPVFGKKSGQL